MRIVATSTESVGGRDVGGYINVRCQPGVGVTAHQGFIQDQIIASHTCFGGHMDVKC